MARARAAARVQHAEVGRDDGRALGREGELGDVAADPCRRRRAGDHPRPQRPATSASRRRASSQRSCRRRPPLDAVSTVSVARRTVRDDDPRADRRRWTREWRTAASAWLVAAAEAATAGARSATTAAPACEGAERVRTGAAGHAGHRTSVVATTDRTQRALGDRGLSHDVVRNVCGRWPGRGTGRHGRGPTTAARARAVWSPIPAPAQAATIWPPASAGPQHTLPRSTGPGARAGPEGGMAVAALRDHDHLRPGGRRPGDPGRARPCPRGHEVSRRNARADRPLGQAHPGLRDEEAP